MAPHKCSYFRCENTSDIKSMFRFPFNDRNRLKVWLNNCGNMTIAHLPPEYLRSRYLCIDHFNQKYVRNATGRRKRLKKMAIPDSYQATEALYSSCTSSPGGEGESEDGDRPAAILATPAEIFEAAIHKSIYLQSSVTQGSQSSVDTTVSTVNSASARSNKKSAATTPQILSGKDDLSIKLTPNESHTSKTNMEDSRTIKTTRKYIRTYSRAHNKLLSTHTLNKQSEKDDALPESTEANVSQTSKDNNTSRTKKCRSIQRADVKLPEAKEIITSVYKFLQAEYEFLKDYIGDICDLSPLTDVLKRTADACGVCEYTVRHVVRKTRDQHDHNVAAPGTREELRTQQIQGEEQSSCAHSEIEQHDRFLFDDSSIIEEELNMTDSGDESEDNVEQADNDSEEQEECEVEAPNMDIDDDEDKPIDPLKTEPVEIQTEFTDLNQFSFTKGKSRCDIPGIEQDDIDLTGDERSSSGVTLVTSLPTVKTEPDDDSSQSHVLYTNDVISDTTMCDVKCEPAGT